MGSCCGKNKEQKVRRRSGSGQFVIGSPGFISGEKWHVPQIREKAPRWTGTAVVDGKLKEISLTDYEGKYLVIFFYPMDFTLVCPTEILEFSKNSAEFKKLECEVVAVSTDSKYSHLAWISQPVTEGGLGPISIPLLADKNCLIAKAYGVYKEDDGTTYRGLFIIDDKQILRQITINDTQVGRSVQEILRLVQAFRFTDVNGEVCSATWRPGEKGILAKKCEGDGCYQKFL